VQLIQGPIENVPGVFVSDIIIYDVRMEGIHRFPWTNSAAPSICLAARPAPAASAWGSCIVFAFARLARWFDSLTASSGGALVSSPFLGRAEPRRKGPTEHATCRMTFAPACKVFSQPLQTRVVLSCLALGALPPTGWDKEVK
jgi:hypothetical protein